MKKKTKPELIMDILKENGLSSYITEINVTSKTIVLVHKKQFRKKNCPAIERLCGNDKKVIYKPNWK